MACPNTLTLLYFLFIAVEFLLCIEFASRLFEKKFTENGAHFLKLCRCFLNNLPISGVWNFPAPLDPLPFKIDR